MVLARSKLTSLMSHLDAIRSDDRVFQRDGAGCDRTGVVNATGSSDPEEAGGGCTSAIRSNRRISYYRATVVAQPPGYPRIAANRYVGQRDGTDVIEPACP